MATRYWVGGTGNWSDATNHWAATSNGAPNVANLPTSADDVVFDNNSNTGTSAFTVTVDGTSASPSLCANFSTSGLDGAMTVSMSATAVLYCYASMTLPAANLTWTGVSGAALYFVSTTTGNTFTPNSVTLTLTHVIFAGGGGAWTLVGTLSCNTLYTNYGTFNTGSYPIICSGFVRNQSSLAGTVNLGSSAITSSSTTAVSMIATNFTLNAGSSTISCSNASPTFAGAGLTYNNVSFTSTNGGGITITGANTFTSFSITNLTASNRKLLTFGANQTVSGTLTLNSSNIATRRLLIVSDVVGTQRTITLNGTLASMTDCDFRDIVTAGTYGTWTGTRIGNGLNNSGITFNAAKTVYWNLAAGGNWAATAWATSSGGTPAANNFPLAQDTAIIQNTGLNTSATITYDVAWMFGTLDSSTRSNAFTLTIAATVTPNVCGNITLSSATTITIGGGTGFVLYGYGITQTITSNSASNASPLTINSVGGTCIFADNFTTPATITLNNGTLNLNNNTITCLTFSSNSNTNVRTLAFGTGTIELTGNNATIWNCASVTNFTITGTPTVNCTYSGSTGTRTISNPTFSNVWIVNFNVSAGSDNIVMGSGTNINYTGFTGTQTLTGTSIYGNLTYGTGMTTVTGTGTLQLAGTSGTQQLTTNSVVINYPITQSGVGGTVQLQDNLTLSSANTLTLTSGTLDLNNKNVSTGLFSSSNSNTRSIAFGTGNVTITGNAATVLNFATNTGFTYTGTPTVNLTYSGSTGSRTIAFGATGASESNVLDLYISAGSDIITTSGAVYLGTLNFTGFTGAFTRTAANFFLYRNLVLGSGMTYTAVANSIFFSSTVATTQTITTNNVTINSGVQINGTQTIQLQDNLTISSAYTLGITTGTFDANNKNISTGLFNSSNANTRALLMGSGTWTLTGTGTVWALGGSTGMTLTPSTSTIVFNGSGIGTFNGGALTYYNLTQSSSNALTISSSNTFNTISNTVQPTTITFGISTSQTFTNFNVNGTAGNLVTINSSTAGTQAIISKASGTVNVSYVSLKDNNATGGAVWQAPSNQGNTIVSNVSGWFTSALYADAVTESSIPADTSSVQASFNSALTENSQPADAITVQANLNASNTEAFQLADTQAIRKIKTLLFTSGSSFTIPADYVSFVAAEVIGGGGGSITSGSNGDAGGGGAYAMTSEVTGLSYNDIVYYSIGAGGGNSGGGDTWINFDSNNIPTLSTQGAKAKGADSSGNGGSAASSVGTIKYSGGTGGNGTTLCGGGGGGAAGPLGPGANGGDATSPSGASNSGGGGGANNGSAGSNGSGNSSRGGGDGGDNYLGLGGGTGSTRVVVASAGTDSGGGGGGSQVSGTAAIYGSGGSGGTSSWWKTSYGPGGGGGGASNRASPGTAGSGALYGGGAGGTRNTNSSYLGTGGQGIIAFTYIAVAFTGGVVENLTSADTPTVQAVFNSARTEAFSVVDILSVAKAYNAAVTEVVTVNNTQTGVKAYTVAISEDLSSAEVSSALKSLIGSISENMVLLDQLISTGWFFVNDNQTVTWNSITGAPSTTWVDIGDSQTPNWEIINDIQ
jgi:hypothetical protein